jgi:CubicO group peptidase (beta-lactamase class C family)
MNLKSLLLSLSLFLPLFSSFGQTNNKKYPRLQEVENSLMPYGPVKGFAGWNINERMKHYGVPGVSIAVINNFKVEWAKGYGLSDTLAKTPVTPQTMFSAGSISKLVNALAAMSLVQNGKLDLDKPINNYLQSWKIAENEFTAKTPITLRMLLSHTAGTTQSSYFGLTPDKKTLPTIQQILSGAPLAESRAVIVNSEPLKEFRYSGGGSMIAQLAIMDVSGRDYAAFTDEAIFKKLGLEHTTFAQPLPEKYRKQASWAYSDNSWFQGMPYIYPQQAAAGLYSTPSDLATIIIDIQNAYRGKGKILQRAITRQMLEPQVSVSTGFYKEQMATGPFLMQRSDNKESKGIYFEHMGVNAGFIAFAIGNLTEGYGAVIMMNKDGNADELGKEIRRAIAKVYNWHNFLPDEFTPVPVAESELIKYEGRYRKGTDEVITFRKEQNYLVQQFNGGEEIYCFPAGKDTFMLTDFFMKGTFVQDDQNNIQSFRVVAFGEPMLKMAANEYAPHELIKSGRLAEAKEGYRQMKLNEYQLTYMAYEFMNRKPKNFPAAQTILELAQEQHPISAIVYARWGDLYGLQDNKAKAIEAYEKALKLEPSDKEIEKKLVSMGAK